MVEQAPSEAEAECAALCKADKVYAVASEDMDSLTFGSTRFLRHLMEPTSRKIPVMEFEIAKVLQELNLTMDQFVDLCILCGCDYCDTIRGGCFSSWRPPSHTFHFRVQHQNLAGTQTVGS
jgi:flap endonuclease-1